MDEVDILAIHICQQTALLHFQGIPAHVGNLQLCMDFASHGHHLAL